MRKLTCQEVLDQLEEFLDDEEAGAQLRAEVEMHLVSCRDCHVYVDSMKRTIMLVKGEEPAMPLHLSTKLHSALMGLYREEPGKSGS